MAIVSTVISQADFVDKTKIKGGDGNLYMACINIGQGDCTFIVCPNGKRMMIDAGQTARGGTTLDQIKAGLPYIKETGELWLDVLVLTHPDQDHYSEVKSLLGTSSIDTLYYSPTPYSKPQNLTEYDVDSFRRWAPKSNVRKLTALHVNAANPHPVDLIADGGHGCKLTAIASNVVATRSDKRAYGVNTASVVVKCVFGTDVFIVAGDATCDTEDFMIQQYTPAGLKVEILRVGHHGSPTSSSSAFVNATDPAIAIISAAAENGYGLPKQSVVERLLPRLGPTAKHTIGYYSTGQQGECEAAVEDAARARGFETDPPAQISTDRYIHETGFNGTFRVVLDGR